MKATETKTKKLMPIGTNLFPILNVGMYGSNIDMNEIAQSFYESLDSNDPRTSDTEHFNRDLYDGKIKAIAQKVVDDWILPPLKEWGIHSITFTEWYHPREYNFDNDSLDMVIEVDETWETDVKTKLLNIFLTSAETAKTAGFDWVQKYISDHWKSRSGFVSLMPQSYMEIVQFKDERDYAAALTLLTLDVIGINVMQQSNQAWFEEKVYDEMLSNGGYEECCTWDE